LVLAVTSRDMQQWPRHPSQHTADSFLSLSRAWVARSATPGPSHSNLSLSSTTASTRSQASLHAALRPSRRASLNRYVVPVHTAGHAAAGGRGGAGRRGIVRRAPSPRQAPRQRVPSQLSAGSQLTYPFRMYPRTLALEPQHAGAAWSCIRAVDASPPKTTPVGSDSQTVNPNFGLAYHMMFANSHMAAV